MPATSSAVSFVEELGAGHLREVPCTRGGCKAVLLPFWCVDFMSWFPVWDVVQT